MTDDREAGYVADDHDAGRVVVLDVVGLQQDHVTSERTPHLAALLEGRPAALRPPFPAVTIPVQTTLGTGQPPSEHGDVANGRYDRHTDSVEFWSRDRGDRDRLWETGGDAGLTTGALFFQHLVGSTADVAITPSPIEDEDDNLLEMNCWTNPDGWYDDLRADLGHFPLHRYWGPGANEESSRWILAAASRAVDRFDPDLLWVYVPHLDYAGLRHGPDSDEFASELETVDDVVGDFLETLRDDRWEETVVAVVSEYGFHAVDTPLFPNRALRDAGLLSTDADGDVDLAESDAFAMVDHQVAHVYADDRVADARAAIAGLGGIDAILDEADRGDRGIDHPNAGDLVAVADPDAWFQYYWWRDDDEAPPYAREMDIHAKPGFDPCELFHGDSGPVSLDPTRVGGSHGRVDESTLGILGFGGPAAPAAPVGPVEATALAPTLADLLGVSEAVDAASDATIVHGG